MRFLLYLSEVQKRFFYLSLSFVFCFFLFFFKKNNSLFFFVKPFVFLLKKKEFVWLDLTEGFSATLKICLILSSLSVFPFLLYQILCFLSPSLYLFEIKRCKRFLFFALTFLLLGGMSALFVFLPSLSQLLTGFEIQSHALSYTLQPRMGSYTTYSTFVFFFTICFFQLPPFLLLLSHCSVLKTTPLIRNRKLLFVSILLFTAFVSPPDIILQSVFFLVFVLVVEFAIWTVFFYEKTFLSLTVKASETRVEG